MIMASIILMYFNAANVILYLLCKLNVNTVLVWSVRQVYVLIVQILQVVNIAKPLPAMIAARLSVTCLILTEAIVFVLAILTQIVISAVLTGVGGKRVRGATETSADAAVHTTFLIQHWSMTKIVNCKVVNLVVISASNAVEMCILPNAKVAMKKIIVMVVCQNVSRAVRCAKVLFVVTSVSTATLYLVGKAIAKR
jgi:hypothetical protein